jgi:hypothetical protein
VIPALVLAAMISGAAPGETAAAEQPAPKRDDAVLAAGKLPDDPARPLLRAKCLVCHSTDYVTQQRLTEKQWQAEVQKMRKFGSPLTDEEATALTGYLARNWTVDLPERRPAPGPPPKGSLPPSR